VSGSVETEGGKPDARPGAGSDARPGAGADARPGAGPDATAPDSPDIDRAAALAEGAPGIPAQFIWWVLGVVLVLSLGGFIGEHIFSASGLNPTPATTTTAPSPVRTSPAETPAPPTPDRSINAPLASFMGLDVPSPRHATPFVLTDQDGRPVSMPAQPARVTVLTFFNAACNDICPVLASEIQQADADLGARAGDVEFVTVNTDPSALAASAEAPAVNGTGLGALPNWHMVTGPLTSLNPLWKAYGVSISLDIKTGLEAHNDVMDFVDPHGIVRYRATPFADESSTRAFTLAAPSEVRWAQGMAAYAGRLVGQ
jgi:cytochrome oxidase Cu insertion factor (SCO1/SenC/PrrC family)